MIAWDIEQRLQLKEWTNANQLAKGAGLSYPVAWRIFTGKRIDRIDVDTLERVAKALGVKNPLSLLKYTR